MTEAMKLLKLSGLNLKALVMCENDSVKIFVHTEMPEGCDAKLLTTGEEQTFWLLCRVSVVKFSTNLQSACSHLNVSLLLSSTDWTGVNCLGFTRQISCAIVGHQCSLIAVLFL